MRDAGHGMTWYGAPKKEEIDKWNSRVSLQQIS